MTRAVRPLIALLALMLTSCLEPRPATELIVLVTSDLSVPDQLARVRVVVRDKDDDALLGERTLPAAPAGAGGMEELRFFIAPEQAPSTRAFRVIATGLVTRDGSERAVVEGRRDTAFIANRTKEIAIPLNSPCLDRACPNETCNPSNGACEPVPEIRAEDELDAGAVTRPDASSDAESGSATTPDAGPGADGAAGMMDRNPAGGASARDAAVEASTATPPSPATGGEAGVPPPCSGAGCSDSGTNDAGGRAPSDGGVNRDASAPPLPIPIVDAGGPMCGDKRCKVGWRCDFGLGEPTCVLPPQAAQCWERTCPPGYECCGCGKCVPVGASCTQDCPI